MAYRKKEQKNGSKQHINMAIFIGMDREGRIMSIISAKNKEIANSYWQGKADIPDSSTELVLNGERCENEEVGYVTPILETYKVEVKLPNETNFRKIRVVK